MTITDGYGPKIYRAPVRYTVTSTTPIRISGTTDPPFRIINLETSGTVWISDNAGLRPGEGQPIRPGTSIQWVRPVALYAVCESGTCEIIITTEIDDWQPDPAAIAAAVEREKFARLIFGIMPAGNIQVNVSQYKLLAITVSFTAASQSLVIELRDSLGQPFSSFIIESGFAATVWRGRVPCYGEVLSVTLNTGTASVVVLGSIREPANRMQQDVIDRGPDAVAFNSQEALWTDHGITLATGNSYTALLNPWFGTLQVEIEFLCTAVPGTSYGQWIRQLIGTGAIRIKRDAFTATSFTNSYQAVSQIPCCGDALEYQIVNSSGASFTTMQIRITPINAFGI